MGQATPLSSTVVPMNMKSWHVIAVMETHTGGNAQWWAEWYTFPVATGVAMTGAHASYTHQCVHCSSPGQSHKNTAHVAKVCSNIYGFCVLPVVMLTGACDRCAMRICACVRMWISKEYLLVDASWAKPARYRHCTAHTGTETSWNDRRLNTKLSDRLVYREASLSVGAVF